MNQQLDLLAEKQEEIDTLRVLLQEAEAARTSDEERHGRRRSLLAEIEQVLRQLMEVPEVWDQSPEIGKLLVKIREEIGSPK